MLKKKYNISIIGTGNVATQLAWSLSQAGNKIDCVFGRSEEKAKELSVKVNSHYSTKINDSQIDSDIVVLAISDNSIEGVAKNLRLKNTIIAHTSGTVSMDILNNSSENFGVFYPLQTFSKGRIVNFTDIPLCIEANNEKSFDILLELGRTVSNNVRKITSEQRKLIHLAAVFVCNFPNHLYTIADNILGKDGIPFEILLPLIKETTRKVEDNSPFNIQTGPAKRGDTYTIRKHLSILSEQPEIRDIYDLLSRNILKYYNRND